MLSNGSQTLQGEKRGRTLVGVRERSIDEMIAEHPGSALERAQRNIIEGLAQLKRHFDGGGGGPVEVDFYGGDMLIRPCRDGGMLPPACTVDALLAHGRPQAQHQQQHYHIPQPQPQQQYHMAQPQAQQRQPPPLNLPQQQTQRPQQLQQHSCPSCGGVFTFGGEGRVSCPHCATALTIGVPPHPAAAGAMAASSPMQQFLWQQQQRQQQQRHCTCPKCGGAFACWQGQGPVSCPHCRSALHI